MYNRLELLNLPRWRTQDRIGLQLSSFDLSLVGNSRARFYDKPQSTAAISMVARIAVIGSFDTFDASLSYSGVKGPEADGWCSKHVRQGAAVLQ